VEALFRQFDGHLARQGYIARGGQILDGERGSATGSSAPRTIVPAPRNRNTRDENKTIKSGEEPEDWADKPAKRSQKDHDARWSEEDQKTVRGTVFPTSKHGTSHYGDNNHVNVDRRHKLIRRWHVSDAAQHDSQAVDHLLMVGNTGSGIWADAAYRSAAMEAKLRARDQRSHIHRKGRRGKPLSSQAKGSNRTKSTVRVRVEHVFGAQAGDMGGTLVRTIGLVRAKAKIGLKTLASNMRRLTQLRRRNPCPA